MWVRGLLRAVSIVAATALSRAAALRPRVLGTTLATAAAARNRHTPHVRGGVLPRRRVQVDELWPAAGVAGAGAAAAANESKAADGDMDCDSDSDLGSRISLHAPM